MNEMAQRVEAALAEVVADIGSKQFASAFGLFLAEHGGKLGRAAIMAMREPTDAMVQAAWRRNDDNDGK